MTPLTPEQQAAVQAAMLRYLNEHRDEIMRELRHDLRPSKLMWDADVLGAGADVLSPDIDDQDGYDNAIEQVAPLMRYSVTFRVFIGDQTVQLETGVIG